MISELIYKTISPIVDLYPVIIDQDLSKIKLPYAISKIRKGSDRRKDGERQVATIQLFVCTQAYDESEQIAKQIKTVLYQLTTHVTSGYEYSVEFDGEDKRYVAQINFTIKQR